MPDLEWDGSEWKDERMVFQGPKNDDKEWKREDQGLSRGPDDNTRLFQGLRYEDPTWKSDELEMKIGEESKMDGQQVIQGPVRKSGEWRRNTRGMFQGSNKAGSAKRRDEGAGHDFVWDEASEVCGPETRRDQPLGGPGWPDGPPGGQGRRAKPPGDPTWRDEPLEGPGRRDEPPGDPAWRDEPLGGPGWRDEPLGGPGRRDKPLGGSGLRDKPPGDSAWRDEPPGGSVWGDQSRSGGTRWREDAGGGGGGEGEPHVNRFRRELGKAKIMCKKIEIMIFAVVEIGSIPQLHLSVLSCTTVCQNKFLLLFMAFSVLVRMALG
jgi:hypothetical protein